MQQEDELTLQQISMVLEFLLVEKHIKSECRILTFLGNSKY